MPEHDLLRDPFNSIYAVNCRIEDTTLHCGALYVEPQNPFQLIRLADSTVTLDVELPEESMNQATPLCAWAVTLPIRTQS